MKQDQTNIWLYFGIWDWTGEKLAFIEWRSKCRGKRFLGKQQPLALVSEWLSKAEKTTDVSSHDFHAVQSATLYSFEHAITFATCVVKLYFWLGSSNFQPGDL